MRPVCVQYTQYPSCMAKVLCILTYSMDLDWSGMDWTKKTQLCAMDPNKLHASTRSAHSSVHSTISLNATDLSSSSPPAVCCSSGIQPRLNSGL